MWYIAYLGCSGIPAGNKGIEKGFSVCSIGSYFLGENRLIASWFKSILTSIIRLFFLDFDTSVSYCLIYRRSEGRDGNSSSNIFCNLFSIFDRMFLLDSVLNILSIWTSNCFAIGSYLRCENRNFSWLLPRRLKKSSLLVSIIFFNGSALIATFCFDICGRLLYKYTVFYLSPLCWRRSCGP